MFHQKVRVRMMKSVEGLKIGGMYFLPKTFATELIKKESAAEVVALVAEPVVEPEKVVPGPSSRKIVAPSQRKSRR